jgi:hypothetical protein
VIACGYTLANAGHDTRALQTYLGHRNIQHTDRRTPKMWAHHRKYQNEWQNKRRAQQRAERAGKSQENSG